MNRDKDAAVVRSSSKESEWGPIRRSFPPPAHDSLPANRVARRYVSSTPSMHAHLQARDYFPLTAVPTQAGGIVFLTLLHLIYAGTFMMLMWMDYKRFVGKPRNSIIGGFRTQMVVGGMQVILALDMLSRGISKLVQAGAYSLFALGLPNLAFVSSLKSSFACCPENGAEVRHSRGTGQPERPCNLEMQQMDR